MPSSDLPSAQRCEVVAPEPAPAAFSDAEIVDWFFGSSRKVDFLTRYMQGVSERWTPDQWRVEIYATMRGSGLTPAATPERDALIEQCAKIAEDAISHEPCLIGQSWSDGWNDAAVHIAAKLRTLKGGSHA